MIGRAQILLPLSDDARPRKHEGRMDIARDGDAAAAIFGYEVAEAREGKQPHGNDSGNIVPRGPGPRRSGAPRLSKYALHLATSCSASSVQLSSTSSRYNETSSTMPKASVHP